MSEGKKPSNAKLGLVFAGVALLFFVAVVIRRLVQ